MIGAFLFVARRTTKNKIALRLRRLREPRYLLSAIAAAVYFFFLIFRRNLQSGRHRSLPFAFAANDLALGLTSLVILVLAIAAWALPSDSGGLEFSPAEIQFLFPAPVSRRQLLSYKLMRGQTRLLFSVVVFTAFGLRHSGFVGLWAAMTVFNLYLIVVQFGRARLRLVGVGFFARLIAVALLLGGLFALVRQQAPVAEFTRLARSGGLTAQSAAQMADNALHQPPMSWILTTPRIAAMAVVPPDVRTLGIGVAGLAVMGAILFGVAIRLNVSFEEASIAVSQKSADRAAQRAGRGSSPSVTFRRAPAPFRLSPTGPPEVAIIWKNLIASLRVSSAWILVLALVVISLLWVTFSVPRGDIVKVTAALTMSYAVLFAFFGSMTMKNDFRLDLPQLEILKSFPMTGERIVAAEMLAPLLALSVVETAMLAAAVIEIRLSEVARSAFIFFGTPEFFVVGVLIAVALCALQLLIRNAAVLLLPAWAIPSKEDARGFVALGQRLLIMVAHLFCVFLGIVPAAILSAGAWLIAHRYALDTGAAIAIATVPGLAVIVAEVLIGVRLLGVQFDSIDVSVDLENAISQ